MEMDKDANPTPAETGHDRLQQARHDVATLDGELHRAAGRMAELWDDVALLRERTNS